MKKAIMLIPVLGGIILQTQAQGFKVGLQGQKQTGMALTGVGYLAGASIIYFNPGALSFIDRSIIYLMPPAHTTLHPLMKRRS